MSDAGDGMGVVSLASYQKLVAELAKLREALEQIYHVVDPKFEVIENAPLHVERIARNALKEGQDASR